MVGWHPGAVGVPRSRRVPGHRRQARTGAGLSDQDIEQGLRRKASKGDVAAARELRERARVAPATEGSASYLALEEMSSEELERLRDRLTRMALRFNERAAPARAEPAAGRG